MTDDQRPDPADVRAVLREHGEEPPERGKLSADWYAKYDAIKAGTAPADGYDAGVTEADFPADEDETAAPPGPEQKPRKPRRTRPAASGLRDRLAGKGKPRGKGKPKRPRIPVDRLIERGWEVLARLTTPVSPPVARCLEMQAPVAGLILEDVVKGTMVDRALQPIARAEDKGRKVAALAGPPMIVAALEQAQRLPDTQRQMREAILVPMLRESLVLLVEVAGEKVDEQMRRAEERGPAYAKADEYMAMIFAPPSPAAGGGMSAEDEDVARAQAGAMAGAGVG